MRVSDEQWQGTWGAVSLEARAALCEEYGLSGLHYCPDAWALRHEWVNKQTGEVQMARCNKWSCIFCGPRKVVLWRSLVCQAEPTLFLTLTKAGKTMKEAARALTTFKQALRRGSKGWGKDHVGARPAYPIEDFSISEEHRDFERNGFHWHVLLKGVEHIPHETLKELWRSATRGQLQGQEADEKEASIVHIERIRTPKAIGYVTKYLMKTVMNERQGTKQVERQRLALVHDEQGAAHVEAETVVDTVITRPHRIRYSRGFFPESVEDLRKRLFAGLEEASQEEESGEQEEPGQEAEAEPEQKSAWVLLDRWEKVEEEIGAYKQQRVDEVQERLNEEFEGGSEAHRDDEVYERYERSLMHEIALEVDRLRREQYERWKRERLLQALERGKKLSHGIINVWYSRWRQG